MGAEIFDSHMNKTILQDLTASVIEVAYFLVQTSQHPEGNDKDGPSTAAVVASNDWPDSGRFIARHRQQAHQVELIADLQELVLELLMEWKFSNQNRLPDVIIFYRDGVGENQFRAVLEHEVQAVKDTQVPSTSGQPYLPLVTSTTVQKRRHTRLFKMGCVKKESKYNQISTQNTLTRSMNMPPGTVIHEIICHPREFDFYLCSHLGEKGTS